MSSIGKLLLSDQYCTIVKKSSKSALIIHRACAGEILKLIPHGVRATIVHDWQEAISVGGSDFLCLCDTEIIQPMGYG